VALRIINQDFFVKIVSKLLSLHARKNLLFVKKSGLKNGSSAKEHCKKHRLKAVNQSALCKDSLNAF